MVVIIIKLILATLLLLCLLPMPFMYYGILRIAVTIGMFLLGSYDNEEKSFNKYSFYVIVAVLFNPLFPIEFERIIWIVIDMALAFIFIIWAVKQYREEYS